MADERPIGIWEKVVRAALLLAIPVVAATVALSIWAYGHHGVAGLLAVTLAAAVCMTGGCLSLSMLGFFQKTAPVQAVLAGVLCRTMIPLFVGTLLAQHERLNAVGVFHYVMVFFGIVLVTETYLAVRIVKSEQESFQNASPETNSPQQITNPTRVS